jgi:hypothetical protein
MRLLPGIEERGVARLRLDGCSNNAIAVLLGLSPSSIDRKVSLIKEIWYGELRRLGEWPTAWPGGGGGSDGRVPTSSNRAADGEGKQALTISAEFGDRFLQ